ncbi:regulatory protein wetA [Geosmithia morbida]|uniref:Regulatory protein wetA n=1 Tax=Geosmithia morbida TaxID=1094350 RepID=A0A9P5D6L8_9HYPO|nr:regulatory protein wetA [Geosmithia morbida]KAF4125731.1 regulatory protein wetA [Geosmithia morbida]
MASWTMQYRTEAMDREPSFFWQELDGVTGDDSNDFFGQFVDFDGNSSAMVTPSMTVTADATPNSVMGDHTVPRLPESSLMVGDHQPQQQQQQQQQEEDEEEDQQHRYQPQHLQLHDQYQQQALPDSLGSSTTEEFDFLSSSSHFGPTPSDIDPSSLDAHFLGYPQPSFLAARGSMSDTELPKVEGMSLSSPIKERFLDAVQSTIRKATHRRKPRQPLPENRPGSPASDAPLRAPKQRPRRGVSSGSKVKAPTETPAPMPMPSQQQMNEVNAGNGSFVHGSCDDPFTDVPNLAPPHYGHRHQHDVSSPLNSPGIKNEAESFQAEPQMPGTLPPDWQVHQPQQRHQSCSLPASSSSSSAGQWNGGGGDMMDSSSWWDLNMVNQNGEYVDPRNADINMAMHSQQAGLPYEYQAHLHQHQHQHQQQQQHGHVVVVPDDSGLMIQMPQPQHHHRMRHHSIANDLHMTAQTQLQPPPPPPPLMPPAHQQATSHRPPRAPSSGARHLSVSPVRKTRAPSASPTRGTPAQKRHSSGGSVSSSARSASGRQPAVTTSVPGTPSGVRKRRSRDPSGGSTNLASAAATASSASVGSGAGGFSFENGGGFVNFTPDDGSMLMTGVAPSGSSKTKARREKEAMDRRRKLSEAAIKAVAAAGGDVDKLMQQGFQF